MDELSEKLLPLVKTHLLPIILGVAGLIFFVYGLTSLSAPKKDKPDILFEAASDKSNKDVAGTSTKEIMIAVDVEGAVMKPGVYKLKADSRIQDALIAAGGMNEEADREKVSKSLNLAGKLVDGAKIYIPAVGEADSVNTTSGGEVTGRNTGSININSASESELDSLAGIGKVTAGKIIDNRPYTKIEDLLEKKIVGKSVFDKIKDKIGI